MRYLLILLLATMTSIASQASLLDDTWALWSLPPATASLYSRWTTTGSGYWSGVGNWSSGIPTNTDDTADFSTVNITANSIITNDYQHSIGNMVFGDTTPSHTWTLRGSNIILAASSGTSTITVSNQTTTIETPLEGSVSLVKAGGGTLVLAGSNTFAGSVTLGVGTLTAQGANSLGGSNIVLLGSAATASSNLLLQSTSANITNNISITTNGTGSVTLTTSSGSGQFTGNIKLERDVNLLAANNVNWATLGGITGTGNVTIVAGSGWAVQLGSVNGGGMANSWVGNLTVDLNGVLVIASGWSHAISTLPDTAIVTNNGTINYSKGANNETVGAMAGKGLLNLSGGTWTVGGGDKSGSYSGVIALAGGLIKIGTGTQTLTATNTYSGGTIVSNGVLSASSYRSIPTNGYLKIVSPATVDLRFTVTNRVTAFWTNGVQLATGTYGSNEIPAYITGGGYIYTIP